MKELYEGLELEVILFSTEDIITTSETTMDTQQEPPENPDKPDEVETPEIDYSGTYEVLSTQGMIFVKPAFEADGKTVYYDVVYGQYWIPDSDGTYVPYP